MTGNWFLMLVWMFVAAISIVELTASYLDNGFASIKTWMFLALLVAAAFFILRLRRLRNNEKLRKK